MRPLAVIGNLARDLVDGRPPRVGGAAFHAGRGLRLLGRPSRIVTKCAESDRGLLLPPLVALGVPVSWRPAASTVSFGLYYDGDERSMTVEELGEPWRPDEIRGWAGEALSRAEWVQVGALLRSDFPLETLAALARGRRRLLDAQALVRVPRTGPLALDADFDPEVLRHVTVLKLSEEEARVLVGEPEDERLLALGVPEVVVTLASRGAIVCANGRCVHVASQPVSGRIDPTGAGDIFGAAYISARSLGIPPEAAARRAGGLVRTLLSGRVA